MDKDFLHYYWQLTVFQNRPIEDNQTSTPLQNHLILDTLLKQPPSNLICLFQSLPKFFLTMQSTFKKYKEKVCIVFPNNEISIQL